MSSCAGCIDGLRQTCRCEREKACAEHALGTRQLWGTTSFEPSRSDSFNCRWRRHTADDRGQTARDDCCPVETKVPCRVNGRLIRAALEQFRTLDEAVVQVLGCGRRWDYWDCGRGSRIARRLEKNTTHHHQKRQHQQQQQRVGILRGQSDLNSCE